MSEAQLELNRTIQRLQRDRPTAFQGYQLIDSFQDGGVETEDKSDRAAVLICVTLLEQALVEAIKTHFISDASIRISDIIRTFHSKITLAYALGVFGINTREVLNNIREIRNLCAHNTFSFSFVSEDMKPLAALLPTALDDSSMLLFGVRVDIPVRQAFLDQVKIYYTYLSDTGTEPSSPKRYIAHPFSSMFS